MRKTSSELRTEPKFQDLSGRSSSRFGLSLSIFATVPLDDITPASSTPYASLFTPLACLSQIFDATVEACKSDFFFMVAHRLWDFFSFHTSATLLLPFCNPFVAWEVLFVSWFCKLAVNATGYPGLEARAAPFARGP